MEYGIKRDNSIVNFYRELNLDYHIGLNNFLQVDDNHRDEWFNQYYTYQRQAYKNRFPEFDECYKAGELPSEKQALLQAWQTGETGFPMVDASMRQLKTMGWMNFRMRAMCATFLTINCGISWHHGAQHYMNYLVDGDLAIDNW